MHEAAPEFSRVVYVSRLSPNGVVEKLQAKPDERVELAKRFDLIHLKSLTAELVIQPTMQGAVKVTGTLEADFIQRCVISLDPLPGKTKIDVAVTFLPSEENEDGAGPADELDEDTEFYQNGRIDIGELVSQQFAVNLDPYPRKPGATLAQNSFGPEIKKPHPFGQLSDLAKQMKKQDKAKD